jgi:two-component system LytT family sensor kinase
MTPARPPFPGPTRLFAAATVIGLAMSAQHYLAMRMVDRPDYHTIGHALKSSLPTWYMWAALAPVVVFFIDRVGFDRRRWVGPLLLHLAFGFALVVVHALGVEVIDRIIDFPGDRHRPFFQTAAMIIGFLIRNLPLSLSSYGAVVGFFLAYRYYQRYRERELATATMAKELAEARLASLRQQLGPHFLFNAMNTIAMLVRKNRRDDAVRTIAGLSDLLRDMLADRGSDDVPLATELDTARRYLDIERIRFEDRLRVTVDAPPATLGVLVPRLLIQPLVENAVRHGIARRSAAGAVDIRAELAGTDLVITVTDDGPGPTVGESSGTGVGIASVAARLEAKYGPRASFELAAVAGGGARATIRLPAAA